MDFQPGAVPRAIRFLGFLNHKVQGGAGHGPIIAFKAELPACVVNEKIHSASFVTRISFSCTRQRRPIVLRIENALARPRRALRIVHWTKRPSFGKMTVTTHIIEPICRLAYRNKSIKERRSFQKMNTKERGCTMLKALIDLASTPGGALLFIMIGMKIVSARLAHR